MIDQQTLSHLLLRYPMLHGLSAIEETQLTTANLLRLEAGAVVFDEGQPCQGFPMLLSGSIRVIKSAPSGRELQLYRVIPSESCILTSSCLLGETCYQARGVVEQASEMVLLSIDTFHHLIANHEDFRKYVFQLFSDRLTGLMHLVTAVAFQKLDQRLAKVLCSRQSPVNITHQALADELGCAREIVSRLLKSFADQGWIRLGREEIILDNTEALNDFLSAQ